jgi:uncharacterized protein (DUF1330 family)
VPARLAYIGELVWRDLLLRARRTELNRKDMPATFSPYDGTFVVRCRAFRVVQGEWPYPRCVIIGFPSRDSAEGWYASLAYRAILPMRLHSSASYANLIDGFA